MNTLEIKNVRKKLGKKEVLKDISFHVEEREIVGLVGENGSGKTTLFRLITGLLEKENGDILVLGKRFTKKDRSVFNEVGCIIESVTLYPNMRGIDHLKWMCKLTQVEYDTYVENLIKKLKMEEYIYKKTKTYSLGMKQKLGIAMALVNRPKFILLDEPMNGLDPTAIHEVRELLIDICHKEGASILITSHILGEMEKLCDRVLLLKDGIIVKSLTKEEIEHETNLEEIFLHQVGQ